MKRNKFIGIFTSAVIALATAITALAAEPTVYLNEGFGTYATNARTIDGYTLTDTDGLVIEENGTNNKGLKFGANGAASIEKTFESAIEENYLVISAYIRSYDMLPSLNITMKNGTAQYNILDIKAGAVEMSDKKKTQILRSKRTVRIDAVIDNRYGRITLYSEGKDKIAQWKMGGYNGAYTSVKLTQKSTNVEFMLDNFAVYSAKKPDVSIVDNNYSDKSKSSLYIEQDGSDFTYFHSNCIGNTKLIYPNTSFAAKTGNSYYAEALQNWKNPEKDDRIILTKTTEDTSYNDVYFSVNINKRGEYLPDPYKKYKSYMMSTDIMITDQSVGGAVLLLRDVTSGKNDEFKLQMKQGALYDHYNNKLSQTFETNRYYHVECYVDVVRHVYDVYLDGELIGKDCKFPESINVLTLFRVTLDKGKGSWIIENMEFRGMAVPYERGTDENGKTIPVIVNSSQFADNNTIIEYLKDKTVFHGDGQLIYKNSEKIPFEAEAVYENNELYVSPADFNKAYDVNIKYDETQQKYIDGMKVYNAAVPKNNNGTLLYPAKSLSIALGYAAKHSGYGCMVIAGTDEKELVETTDKDMPWFDEIFYNAGSLTSKTMRFSDIQEISNFIFYDRPDADEIKEDFYATLGENPSHPRLLINSDDVTRLRNQYATDEYFKNIVDNIVDRADSYVMSLPLIHYGSSTNKSEAQVMGTSENMRTLSLAFRFNEFEDLAIAYVVTGDRKYADRAIEQLMVVVDTFPDLNPNHIIDVGTWLRSISVIYDWCYDAMTEEQRAKTAKFIHDKGVATVNKAYYAQLPASGGGGGYNDFQTAGWFVTWKSNYISYTQGGLAMACLAIADLYPEKSFDTLEKALRSWEYENMGYYPGGVWLEGKSYQQTLNGQRARAFGSMLSCLGTTYKMLEYPGMHESLHAMMSYSSLSGAFTFSDDTKRGALGGIDGSYQFFANVYDDPVLSLWRQMNVPNIYSAKYTTPSNSNNSYNYFDVIYYEPMPDESVLNDFKKVEYYEGGEIFSVHENWLDKNATFFCAAGGPTLVYHRHYDMGDFMFIKDDIQWVYEFGQGNYNVGNIWTRFGGRSEAHNTITINNAYEISQREDSFVPVTKWEEGEGGAYAVYDMKEVYAHHGTEKMDRGFYIGDNYESLRIRDEMSFSKTVTGYWHMHTEAEVFQLDEHTMLLSKNGKNLILHADYEAEGFKTEFSVSKARPLPESPSLEKDKQKSTNVNQIRIKFVGKGDINLTVELYDYAREIDTTPISEWKAPGINTDVNADGYDYSIDIYADGRKLDSDAIIPVSGGAYPDFEIKARDNRLNVEMGEVVKEVDVPMLVKLSNEDGSRSGYAIIKYSEFGEAVKNVLYNDVEIKDYWVSSEPEPANCKENMFDNNFSSRLSMYYDNATATFDLGEPTQVDGLALGVWKGNEREYYFDIQVSDDGENFRTVGEYTSSGKTEDYEFYTFPTETARYVRFVGHMNSAGDVNNILELRVIRRK